MKSKLKVFVKLLYFQMSQFVWEVSKYDLNDLHTDHLLYLLHKMEWEDVFELAEFNEAFHKMIYRIRGRNIMLSSEMNNYWGITDRFPYLENITILDDSPLEFRERLRRLRGIRQLEIIADDLTIDYITSDRIYGMEMVAPNSETRAPTIDYLIHVLRINRNMDRLVYAHGFLSNESIYYMMRNKIRSLKLTNVHTEHSTTLGSYLRLSAFLRNLSIGGTQSRSLQDIIFTMGMADMDHIVELEIHILNTKEVDYDSIRNYRNLRSVTLFFNYGHDAESNVLNILNIMRNATFLQYVRIYRLGNDLELGARTHSLFHAEIYSHIDFFQARGIDFCTRTGLY